VGVLVVVCGAAVALALGCGDRADEGPRDPRTDRIYDQGLASVLEHARTARERQDLRRGYDLGFTSGSEEAIAVNARSTDEMRRLGCRLIHPQVADRAARSRHSPPSLEELCPPVPVTRTLGAADGETPEPPRHHGRVFASGRGRAEGIAQDAPDRRLRHLVLEAYEYGYERGYRARLEGWDESRSHELEVEGCEAAVERAIRDEHVTVFEREPLLARCDALPVHRLGID